jgi:hypothetical protein
MTPEELAEFQMMDNVLYEEYMKYISYSLNIQRAIDELMFFINHDNTSKISMSKLINILIKARKNDYMNKNLDYDPNITEEEFIEAMDFSNYKSITINDKIYFNCEIDPKAIFVLSRYEDRFIFKTNIDNFWDKNIVKCTKCKERYLHYDFSYNINIGCKNRKYKWHQDTGVIAGIIEE